MYFVMSSMLKGNTEKTTNSKFPCFLRKMTTNFKLAFLICFLIYIKWIIFFFSGNKTVLDVFLGFFGFYCLFLIFFLCTHLDTDKILTVPNLIPIRIHSILYFSVDCIFGNKIETLNILLLEIVIYIPSTSSCSWLIFF